MKSILQTEFWNRAIFADRLGKSAIFLVALALPFSTAVVSVGMILTVLAFLLRGNWQEVWKQLQTQPFIKGVGALLLLVSLGVFYSEAPWSFIGESYQDVFRLMLFLCWLPFLKSQAFRKNLFIVFTVAVGVLILLSNLKYFGVLDLGRQYARSAVFKDYQINALIYSMLAFMYFTLAILYPKKRKLFLFFAVLLTTQTIFINEGRIGYGYISLLVLYAGWVASQWRGVLKSSALLILLFISAYQISPNFNNRMTLLFDELKVYQQVSQNSPASLHLRINFARNTLQLIAQKPWLGYGTGSFAPIYKEQSALLGWIPTSNPHNYYLLITMQYGLLGLSLLIGFFIYLWCHTTKLPRLEQTLARGLLLVYGFGCGYNSMLMDYTETIFFALMLSVVYVLYQPAERSPTLTTLRHVTVH